MIFLTFSKLAFHSDYFALKFFSSFKFPRGAWLLHVLPLTYSTPSSISYIPYNEFSVKRFVFAYYNKYNISGFAIMALSYKL